MTCFDNLVAHPQADLRRADLIAKQRARDDAVMALEVYSVVICIAKL